MLECSKNNVIFGQDISMTKSNRYGNDERASPEMAERCQVEQKRYG